MRAPPLDELSGQRGRVLGRFEAHPQQRRALRRQRRGSAKVAIGLADALEGRSASARMPARSASDDLAARNGAQREAVAGDLA